MLTLPEIPGRYPVGATTFAVPVKTQDEAARIIGRAKLKPSSGGQPDTPALKLEEVAFTVYYPADISPPPKNSAERKRLHWVPR